MKAFMLVFLLTTALHGQISLVSDKKAAIFPPYIGIKDGLPAGYFVDALTCGLEAAKKKANYSFLPWTRAQKYLELGKIDGIFPAFRTPERDRLGVFFPLIESRIVWFSKKDTPFKLINQAPPKTATIGVKSSGWAEAQVKSLGYPHVMSFKSFSSLLQAIKVGRIDFILVSSFFLAKFNIAPDVLFKAELVLRRNVGIYLAKGVLSKSEAENFKAALVPCTKELGEMLSRFR